MDAPSAAPASGPPNWAVPDSGVVERVGRGLFFSLGGVVIGMLASALLWQQGFIAAFASMVMAYACTWLYHKGAGRPARAGAPALIGVIVFGVFASLVAAFASDAIVVAQKLYPGAIGEQAGWVVAFLTNPEVWRERSTSVWMYLLLAGVGNLGILLGLNKSRGN